MLLRGWFDAPVAQTTGSPPSLLESGALTMVRAQVRHQGPARGLAGIAYEHPDAMGAKAAGPRVFVARGNPCLFPKHIAEKRGHASQGAWP